MAGQVLAHFVRNHYIENRAGLTADGQRHGAAANVAIFD